MDEPQWILGLCGHTRPNEPADSLGGPDTSAFSFGILTQRYLPPTSSEPNAVVQTTIRAVHAYERATRAVTL
jgi:hypothetical protein